MIDDCYPDYDPYPGDWFAGARIVLARKPHRCCECAEGIAVGERHEVAKGVSDGRWWTARTCLPCSIIRREYCPLAWEYGSLRDELWDQLDMDYVTGRMRGDDSE